AVGSLQSETVRFLIKSGAKDVDAAVLAAAANGNSTMAQAVLDTAKVNQDALDAALFLAAGGSNSKLKAVLAQAGARALPPASEDDRKSWTLLAGTYDSDGGQKLTIAVHEAGLVINGRIVKAVGPETFVPLGTAGTSYHVERKDGKVSRITL